MAHDDDLGSEPMPLSDVLAREYASLGRPVEGSTPLASDEAARRRVLFRQAHGFERPLSALCISGGGIRSATFALGALQSLARQGVLGQFDYLSTVSGGGYIGSWLSAWIHRAGGLSAVLPRLFAGAPADDPGRSPGVDPIRHLREFNSYLTPRLGLGSADTWTLAAIIGRNLLLNWLLLVPLLMIPLMAPRLLLSLMQVCPPGTGDPFPGFPILEAAMLMAAVLLYAVSTFYTLAYLPGAGGRPHTEEQFVRNCLAPLLVAAVLLVVDFWWYWDDMDRVPSLAELTGVSVAVSLVAWLVCLIVFARGRRFVSLLFGAPTVAALTLGLCSGACSYLLTHHLFDTARNIDDPSFYAAFSLPLLLLGLVLGGALFVGFTSRTLGPEDREWMARAGAFVLRALAGWLVLSAIVLVIPHLLFGLSGWVHSAIAGVGGVSGWLAAFRPQGGARPANVPAAPGGSRAMALLSRAALPTFVFVFLLGLTVLTSFILSGAGLVDASWTRPHELLETSSLGVTLGFTATLVVLSAVLSRYINVNTFSLNSMYRYRLVRAYLAASNAAHRARTLTGFDEGDDLPISRLRGQRPLHVVNQTLNLVSGPRLDWQQRKAESFVMTPLFAGSRDLGYRDSARYGGRGGVTLGTAVSISGAAASPNMGDHSSPLVGFTMMLFNARLGWWLGNPGVAGRKTWTHDGPRTAAPGTVREMFGLTNAAGRYVYLSDGGHFENLALYEMVLRRCRTIVVLDGGCDPGFTYEDLGNALRKIRIDLGVPIDFDDASLVPLLQKEKRCAVAAIRYSAVDEGGADGRLVYVKPMRRGDEPPDVLSYAAAHLAFPHESTSNQWFSEAQTESYRMLGQFTLDEIGRGFVGRSVADFAGHASPQAGS